MGGLFGHLYLTRITKFQILLVSWGWTGLRGGHFAGVEAMSWISGQGAALQCCATLVRVCMGGNSTEAVGWGIFQSFVGLNNYISLALYHLLNDPDKQGNLERFSEIQILSKIGCFYKHSTSPTITISNFISWDSCQIAATQYTIQ